MAAQTHEVLSGDLAEAARALVDSLPLDYSFGSPDLARLSRRASPSGVFALTTEFAGRRLDTLVSGELTVEVSSAVDRTPRAVAFQGESRLPLDTHGRRVVERAIRLPAQGAPRQA